MGKHHKHSKDAKKRKLGDGESTHVKKHKRNHDEKGSIDLPVAKIDDMQAIREAEYPDQIRISFCNYTFVLKYNTTWTFEKGDHFLLCIEEAVGVTDLRATLFIPFPRESKWYSPHHRELMRILARLPLLDEDTKSILEEKWERKHDLIVTPTRFLFKEIPKSLLDGRTLALSSWNGNVTTVTMRLCTELDYCSEEATFSHFMRHLGRVKPSKFTDVFHGISGYGKTRSVTVYEMLISIGVFLKSFDDFEEVLKECVLACIRSKDYVSDESELV